MQSIRGQKLGSQPWEPVTESTHASSTVLIAVDEDGGTHGPRLLSRLRVVCEERIVIVWIWDVTASWLC